MGRLLLVEIADNQQPLFAPIPQVTEQPVRIVAHVLNLSVSGSPIVEAARTDGVAGTRELVKLPVDDQSVGWRGWTRIQFGRCAGKCPRGLHQRAVPSTNQQQTGREVTTDELNPFRRIVSFYANANLARFGQE